MKVLNVFGLQPTIRSDLESWSPDLFATFLYLSNRSNDRHKHKAMKTLDLLFDATEHNSYFGKLNFGSKEKFKTLSNSSLYLLILTWLRQLEQYFYNFEGNGDSHEDVKDPDLVSTLQRDWNKHRKYYGTPSMLKAAPLANINMAQANETRTPVTEVSFLNQRIGMGCVSHLKNGEQEFSHHTIKKIYVMLKLGVQKPNYGSNVRKKLKCFFHSLKQTFPTK